MPWLLDNAWLCPAIVCDTPTRSFSCCGGGMDDTCDCGSQRYTQTTDFQHCSPLVRATVVFPDHLWRLICPTAMQVCAGGCTPEWFGPLLCYTEKATLARHRLERQHTARSNRRKQCSPKPNHTPSRHSRAKGKLLLQTVIPHTA